MRAKISFNCRDIHITAVDIDSSMLTVATDYFGLVQDNRLKVVIDDGIKFLKKTVKNGNIYLTLIEVRMICSNKLQILCYFSAGQSFKAILFDVDSKDCTVGMSCPPVQFLEQDVLNTVQSCIRENG